MSSGVGPTPTRPERCRHRVPARGAASLGVCYWPPLLDKAFVTPAGSVGYCFTAGAGPGTVEARRCRPTPRRSHLS
jgi:hypothetical protein